MQLDTDALRLAALVGVRDGVAADDELIDGVTLTTVIKLVDVVGRPPRDDDVRDVDRASVKVSLLVFVTVWVTVLRNAGYDEFTSSASRIDAFT